MMIAAAYHEAGHAVAATVLDDNIMDVRVKLDARNVGDIGGGVTRHNPLHRRLRS
jgi:hypothetical protein